MPKLQRNANNRAGFTDERCWRAVEERDRSFDGRFVYAVLSTRVYCRPGCPSRRPARERVTFFAAAHAAEGAGFRPCKRCRPQETARPGFHVPWMREACRYIEDHRDERLSLAAMAARVGISRFSFQRAFKRETGVSPREYADARRVDLLKSRLRGGSPVADALYEAGYGSSSRLYERAPAHFGMTPATYRKGGLGMEINYAFAKCGLGSLLVAATERGVCAVRLGDSVEELERGLRAEFPRARIDGGDVRLAHWVKEVVAHIEGNASRGDIPMDIQGTAFQRRVWNELRKIPYGETRSYGEIARAIGQPAAMRAVGHACATNPIAIVVPCHRVVRSDGQLGGYAGGINRKQALLERERANSRGKRAASA